MEYRTATLVNQLFRLVYQSVLQHHPERSCVSSCSASVQLRSFASAIALCSGRDRWCVHCVDCYITTSHHYITRPLCVSSSAAIAAVVAVPVCAAAAAVCRFSTSAVRVLWVCLVYLVWYYACCPCAVALLHCICLHSMLLTSGNHTAAFPVQQLVRQAMAASPSVQHSSCRFLSCGDEYCWSCTHRQLVPYHKGVCDLPLCYVPVCCIQHTIRQYGNAMNEYMTRRLPQSR
jgi:hypothetical protein